MNYCANINVTLIFVFPRVMSFFSAISVIYLLLYAFKFLIYHNYSGFHS